MKYVDEYRNLKLANKLSRQIHRLAAGQSCAYNFMEVCGTHTNTFFRYGLKGLLPENVHLISGPGCPVCVTDTSYIDNAISFAGLKNVIVATFGDMMKVPGSSSSLYEEKAKGHDIRVVYSTLDALKIAKDSPSKQVIFLGVGFETTAPTIAMAVLEARRININNFLIYSGHKLIPPALKQLLTDSDICIDGFILPAHVSAIIGQVAYNFLKRFDVPGVIAGFEPLDMLQGIAMLLHQLKSQKPKIEIQYSRAVKKSGNKKAQRILERVFKVSDARWRGLGNIPRSGLKLRREFRDFDAESRFKIKRAPYIKDEKHCLCGEILKGKDTPENCKLFAKACTPESPKGPCMVSSEGSCSVYYKYGLSHAKSKK
jgi:hydrogenase expression/formation protein HypD